jgi:hypothetical protein
MGVLALGIGAWVVAYLIVHPTLEGGAQALAIGTAVVCFAFGAYVLVRRVMRGAQH